jgi:anti-sigma factor RsiW
MTRIEDDATLRRAFASLAGTASTEAPGSCPEPERIYDAVRGKLPPGELREVVEHLADCPACAEAWRLAAAFEEEAGAAVPATMAARPFPRLVAVAASVLVALLAVGVWWTAYRAPEEVPVYRAAGDAEIVSLLPDGQALDREHPVLRWQVAPPGAPDGTTYDVLVTTADLEAVAEASELEEPRFELPADALEDLPAGTELLWRVVATTPEGRRFTSPTFVTPLG